MNFYMRKPRFMSCGLVEAQIALPHPRMSALVRAGSRLGAVLVVAPEPSHRLVLLVASFRGTIKDRVIAHQELGATRIAGVAVVDLIALARERTEPVSLGEITFWAGPGRHRVPVCDQRQAFADGRLLVQELEKDELVRLEQRRGRLVSGLSLGRHAVVVVEVALSAGHPVEVPAHSLPIGQQFLDRGTRDADHRHVVRPEVCEHPVETVSSRRTGWAPTLVVGAEHEVVDQKLRPAVK